MEGKSTARRQLDSLLDGLDEKEISIVAATAQAIIDARTEGGERLRPTFLFLLEEKKKCADLRAKSLASLGCAPKRACGRRPGTKKKSAWSGFRDESCFFFACALRPDGSTLVLCGLVLPLTPLPLTGVGGLLFYVEKSGFHSESRLIYCSKMYSISFAAERLFFSASALICSSSSVLIRIVKRV